MSMKFFTGIQDFLGLYDPTVTSSIASNSSSASHISSIFGTAANNRPTQQRQQPKRSPSTINKEELGDQRISRCSHSRSVHFPEDDSQLVSGYHEAPTNSFHLKKCYDVTLIAESYCKACKLAKIAPNPSVEHQIACFHQIIGLRQECLSLKGQRLSQAHMECLEEIFRRVQFDTLDFEYTFIDDDAAVSLAEMLEFYDSTTKLNLSFNKQINIRGWQALFRAIKNCQSLQLLNLRYTSLSDRAIPVLARTLRTQPTLTTLHLENVSLSGKNLLLLVCALKTNTMLRELYLGENNLQPADGAHLYQLIVGNTSIQMLDLRNNQLQDGGLRHICDALRNKETLQKSALSALVLWNNRLTSSSMDALANALMENSKLETLNIGSNNLSVDGIMALKPALLANSSLQRLGLQATNLDCQCAIVLAECLADNSVMVRVDLRDNVQIGSAGLLALHLAMKMNTSITLLNLDNSCANSNSTKVKEYHDHFKLYFDEIKAFCERNKQAALKKLSVQSSVSETAPDSDSSDDGQTKCANDKQEEEVVEDGHEKETYSKAKGDGSEMWERAVPVITRQKSVDSASHRIKPVWKFTRSSSLTCTELVEDINERILQMSRSCSTLDSVGDESAPPPLSQKNSPIVAVPAPPKAEIGKSPSLPALPLLATVTDSTATIKKPNRRFSVTLSTHSASSPDLRRPISPRFKVMPVSISSAHCMNQSSLTSQTVNIVMDKKNTANNANADRISPKPSGTAIVDLKTNEQFETTKKPSSAHKIVNVSSKNANSTPLSDTFPSEGANKIVEKESAVSKCVTAESKADGNHSGPDSCHLSTEVNQRIDSSPTADEHSVIPSPISRVSENHREELKINSDSKEPEFENVRKAINKLSQKVESGHNVREVAQLNVQNARFAESVPIEFCSEVQCVGGCSIHNLPEFSIKQPQNDANIEVVTENLGSGPGPCGAVTGVEANRAMPVTVSCEDARDSTSGVDVNSSNIFLQFVAAVQTPSDVNEVKIAACEIQRNDLCDKASACPCSHIMSNLTDTESPRECNQPIFTVDGTENNSGCQNRSQFGDSDDFVFVVTEKSPTGCNFDVLSESKFQAKQAAAISQSSGRPRELMAIFESGPPRMIGQVGCTGGDEVLREVSRNNAVMQMAGCSDEYEGCTLKKPSDIDSVVVTRDSRAAPITRLETSKVQEAAGKIEWKGNLSEAKKLEHLFERPLMTNGTKSAIPAVNANQAHGELRVRAGYQDAEVALNQNPRPMFPQEDALHLNDDLSDEEVVSGVVKDLVNFTSFEMGDEEGFRCCNSKSPLPSSLFNPLITSPVTGFSPPKILTAETNVSDKEENDEQVIYNVMRTLVREVLLSEKNVLSRNLKRKRERLNNKEIPSLDLS